MSERTFFSLSQAAKETGKSKSVIHKSLKNGEISYASHTKGQYRIDAAELFRVFPRTVREPLEKNEKERSRTPDERPENAVLQARIEGLEREIDQLARQRDDLGRRLDLSDEERRNLTRMLTDQRQTATAVPEKPAGRGLRFLGFEIRRAG